jgi:hypothetical protein
MPESSPKSKHSSDKVSVVDLKRLLKQLLEESQEQMLNRIQCIEELQGDIICAIERIEAKLDAIEGEDGVSPNSNNPHRNIIPKPQGNIGKAQIIAMMRQHLPEKDENNFKCYYSSLMECTRNSVQNFALPKLQIFARISKFEHFAG